MESATKGPFGKMRKLSFLSQCLCGCLLWFIGLSVAAGAQQNVPGEWAWMGGSSTVPSELSAQPGVYGTLGTPAQGNTPGGREYALGWTDSSGNFWLFGGLLPFSSQWNYLNDLWKFDPVTSEWTWISGSSSTAGTNCPVFSSISYCGRSGTYGTVGTPATGNTPGGRYQAETWVDLSGNFWLYGGLGFDANGNWGALSDLWRFTPSTNEWTWMGGNNTVPVNATCISCILGQSPVPGTLGTPATGNTPGGLWQAATWTDNSGNFWLLGGWGYNTYGNGAIPNDLWQFNSTSNEWAWMGGSSTFGGDAVAGIYGVLGKPASGNFPGSRWLGATWTDSNGNFWLFGGQGDDASDTEGILNDLWEFSPTTNQWAWIGGNSTLNCSTVPVKSCYEPGEYGTLGVPASGNIPGSRLASYSWRDVKGNLWLFGGQGVDANSNVNVLNDLWEYSPANNEWAWMGGLTTVGLIPSGGGLYGTLGTPSPGNQPGRRYGGVSWTDKSGNFWLWGGVGLDANLTEGYLNDLWVYRLPSTLPSFTVSGTAVSVAPGATSGNTSTITITPAGGFTGSVILTAALTSSPSGAFPPTLSFNSTNPVSITGNSAGAAALTVVTTPSVSSNCAASNQSHGGVWYAESAVALAGLVLFVTPKRSRRWRSTLSLVISFIVLVGGIVGCSGTKDGAGSGACSNITTPGTTAGTYVITVTATSSAITEKATVNVTVQ
jgi:N-acetylneuraminic acid mutarotase